jgi:diacylglycerol kinase (ATP)
MEETDRDQDVNRGTEAAKTGVIDGTQPAEDAAVENKKTAGPAAADGRKTAGPAAGQGGKAAGPAGGQSRKKGRRKNSGAAETAGQAGRKGSRTGKRKKAVGKSSRKHKTTAQTITKSFGHAFDGILAGFEERNMKIHCTMAVLVVFFGLVLHISVTEWCICLVLFGLIMGLELVNTALEAVVDLVTKEYQPLAKRAKDTAAGAVLIAAIMAAATGLIIFIPRLLYVIRSL